MDDNNTPLWDSSNASDSSEASPSPAQEPTSEEATITNDTDSVPPKNSTEAATRTKTFYITDNIMKKASIDVKTLSHSLPLYIVFSFILVAFVATAVFFIYVKGPEEVMVPNVVGKLWSEALPQLQNKELYAKVTFRHTDNPADKDIILEQSPAPSAIVKGYSRVNLVISSGPEVGIIEDYVGMTLNDLKLKFATMFSVNKPLIVIDSVLYKADSSPEGTILAQEPPVDTKISDVIKLQLVVSKGAIYEKTKMPLLVGEGIESIIDIMNNTKIIFDFTAQEVEEDGEDGIALFQSVTEGEFVPNYSHVNITLAINPQAQEYKVYGIFSAVVSKYPYVVNMALEAKTSSGKTSTIASIMHSGGEVTIPYSVEKNTTLSFFVAGKLVKEVLIN